MPKAIGFRTSADSSLLRPRKRADGSERVLPGVPKAQAHLRRKCIVPSLPTAVTLFVMSPKGASFEPRDVRP